MDNKNFDSRWKIMMTILRVEKSVSLTAGTYTDVEAYSNGTGQPSKYRTAFKRGSRWYLTGSYGTNNVRAQITSSALRLSTQTTGTYTVRYYLFNQYIDET